MENVHVITSFNLSWKDGKPHLDFKTTKAKDCDIIEHNLVYCVAYDGWELLFANLWLAESYVYALAKAVYDIELSYEKQGLYNRIMSELANNPDRMPETSYNSFDHWYKGENGEEINITYYNI